MSSMAKAASMTSPANPIALIFGRNLAAARERSGLSQEKTAVRASLHRTEIGMLERGERLPRIDTVIKLAGALGVSCKSLLVGIEWIPGSSQRGTFFAASDDGDDQPGARGSSDV